MNIMVTHTNKPSLLIVEDEHYLRELYVDIFAHDGFEVDSAEDGNEAYSKMKSNEYDLVLLDIILPGMDGMQVLDKLVREKSVKLDNIVLLTNLSQDLVIAKALDYGVRGYLIKSDYTPDQLLNEVKSFLNNNHA
ncbi:MAG: response regulator [bacterium]|nr:response regulator [bacterium]